MNKKTTKAIVLKRLNYGDSDRIITILTPDFGKISLLAKGVRKIKSKLAGGIELFAVFDAGFIMGRGDMGSLASARLDEFYGNIIHDIERVQLGYEILRSFDKSTEDSTESSYFYLLCQLLRLLNEPSIQTDIIELYSKARLLMLAGHTPNLYTDVKNEVLSESSRYELNVSSMSLAASITGRYEASHIKLLRMLFGQADSPRLFKVQLNNEGQDLKPAIDAMFRTYL
ncbi:MAG: DNA repair protein RecO [Candidatus Saccharimonadales bacterium]